MVNKFLAGLRDGLFPQYCLLCELPADCELPLCRRCARILVPNNRACSRCALPLPGISQVNSLCGQCQSTAPDFDRVLAPWLYDDALAYLITQWKFHGQLRLTSLLAQLWQERVPRPPEVDILTPLPLHWRKLWMRGFNQSDMLCKALSKRHPALGETPIERMLLTRTRATKPQTGMTAAQRRHNLDDAFTCQRPCDNLTVAVLDDVLTTGATAGAAARVLRQAGAKQVQIWCLARTPSPRNL